MYLRELLFKNAGTGDDHIAAWKYEYGEFASVSSQDFYNDINRAEGFWRSRKTDRKKNIAIVAENSYAYFVQLLGIMLSGETAVPINQNYPADELTEFLFELDIDEVLADDDWAYELRDLPIAETIKIIVLDEAFAPSINTGYKDNNGEEDTVLMLLSSGTSGKSKAVELSQKNLTTSCMRFASIDKSRVKTTLQVLPLYHIGGVILSLEELAQGNTIVISSAKYYLMQVGQAEFEKLIMVPSMAKNLFDKAVDREDLEEGICHVKEILCVGAALSKETTNEMLRRSIRPWVYYGMTETTGTVSCDGPYKEGACGIVAGHNEVRINDNGEILIRGDNVTKGYYKNSAETKKILVDGWLNTGDVGEIDEEGYLFLRGRTKSIIILANGENVSPEELEEKIQKCDLVEEVLVYGKESVIAAKVYCNVDNEDTRSAVKAFIRTLNKSLPTTKKIKDIEFSDAPLPKSSLGKIKRGN